MEIKLTIVELDLVKFSEKNEIIYELLETEGTEAFYRKIKKFVDDAFKKLTKPDQYDIILARGGDGYRIAFRSDNAYEFVKNFAEIINGYNKTKDDEYKLTFRIAAITDKLFYDASRQDIDRVRGNSLSKLARLVVEANPGWFYIDKETFKNLAKDKKTFFSKTTLIKGKSHDRPINNVYCCQIIDISTSENLQLLRELLPPLEEFISLEGLLSFEILDSFEFLVVTVDVKGNKIHTKKNKAFSFLETLGKGLEIEMVKIPGGTFKMGSPENELKRYQHESPQHQVTVQPFFIGKYQITQEQWKAVANLPQVKKRLKLEPSHYKGKNLPVETVSWNDAVEFCARLSKHTGRKYRLPSEAEWEYACRAGTTTPFHFGETITSELANYDANYSFADAPKGEYRRKPIPVGSFGVANAFGLYDMHGNISELCFDDWHFNYKGAPTDGSAWFDNNNIFRKFSTACLRGGSFTFPPENCRSARRGNFHARVLSFPTVGFRVVCEVKRTYIPFTI